MSRRGSIAPVLTPTSVPVRVHWAFPLFLVNEEVQLNNVLIIGAGGVGNVVTHKCAQNNDVLGNICLASRTVSKCHAIVESVRRRGNLKNPGGRLYAAQLQAKDTNAVIELIKRTESSIVINVAAPFCNASIMEACLQAGAHYIDTALYEKEDRVVDTLPWYAAHEWRQRERFAERGITGLLGAGFDPGAVNVFCAYAQRHLFDTIDTIDIMDVNAGHHGRFFATNFDPEVNLYEVLEDAIYWENGEYVTVPRHSKSRTYDFPVVGEHRLYSMGHDELHSLPSHFPARRIEFWMSFSEQYLSCFNVLERIGLLSHLPVTVGENEVAPLQLLKAILPVPASLAPDYRGKTCIGALLEGQKDGGQKKTFLYNVCDHEACYAEVGSQAISYTTGVPAVTAAVLIARGDWNVGRLCNLEELDPEPFLELMPRLGLSWQIREE